MLTFPLTHPPLIAGSPAIATTSLSANIPVKMQPILKYKIIIILSFFKYLFNELKLTKPPVP